MIILNFYRFNLAQINGKPSLFKPDESGEFPSRYRDGYECLASFFDVQANNLALVVTKITTTGDRTASEPDTHKCDVMRIHDGVILFTIENNRIKHTTVDKQDIENPHHPYTHIILDTRPGRHVMAIERNTAFGSTQQNLIEVLKEGIDNLIGPYKMEIQFTELKKNRTDFWEAIDDLRVRFNDSVKQIKIDFQGNARETDSNDMLRMLTVIARKANADGSLQLCGTDEGEVNINEIREDLEGIANICLTQPAYSLAVRFRNFGLYRYGASVAAQFELDEKVLDEFVAGNLVMNFDTGECGYAILEWLDKIYSLLNGYDEKPITLTGRKNRNRR